MWGVILPLPEPGLQEINRITGIITLLVLTDFVVGRVLLTIMKLLINHVNRGSDILHPKPAGS